MTNIQNAFISALSQAIFDMETKTGTKKLYPRIIKFWQHFLIAAFESHQKSSVTFLISQLAKLEFPIGKPIAIEHFFRVYKKAF